MSMYDEQDSEFDDTLIFDRKDIKDKPNPLLMPYEALCAYSAVSDYGNTKYGNRDTWIFAKEGVTTYSAAAARHLFQSHAGTFDKESNLPHLYHAVWNICAAIWHLEQNLKEAE